MAGSFEARRAFGREARNRLSRAQAGGWTTVADRVDPVALLAEQGRSRVPELLPIRHGRMMASPFTFYRGAALIMASDLARTENSGLTTQLCGDAHLANFGLFGTPERRMVFDINDFDETHPGPFEWDVKRLVTSFEIAGRHRSFSAAQRRDASLTVTRAYREHMAKAARAPVLDVWYDNVDADKLMAWIAAEQKDELVRKRQVKAAGRTISKAMSRTNVQAFSRLVGEVDGELRIRSDPPLIVPLEDIVGTPASKEGQQRAMQQLLSGYQTTIASGRRPLDEFRYRHMARKVVGVGSVGTRAWIVLLSGRDDHDPLILQAKEAQASVLERFLEPSEYQNHAERVVRGQRLMQAASDMFLGWQRVTGFDGALRDFYIRQLHDWKGAVDLETIRFPGTLLYARLCGETLARAHARAGDRVAIAAYLGTSDRFDRAMADFAVAYADQNDSDYRRFVDAIDDGRLPAEQG